MLVKYARKITKLRNGEQCNYPKKRILATNEALVYFIYNIAISTTWYLLRIPAFFNAKLRLFIKGRHGVFSYLDKHITQQDKIIWIHAASLGEFEQGLPVIQKLRSAYPGHKILVTFFSPSGYEVKKNSEEAHLITYLPMDISHKVDRFLEKVRPVLAIFVKYEVWPNYLRSLQKMKVPVLMISGRFNSGQVFFKWYGSFMRNALGKFTHLFVQDSSSFELLQKSGFSNTTLSGDTRFDRVSEILERNNSLNFMERFKGTSLCLVLGSSWPEDEALLGHYLQQRPTSLKVVIAPHDMKEGHLQKLRESIPSKVIFYSDIEDEDLSEYQVLILDTIGLLTKVYSYADIAYVGGGFATGLHNTLEPAVFGIPVVVGPQYDGFNEARDLVSLGGISVVDSAESFTQTIDQLVKHTSNREKMGKINAKYVEDQKGASIKIVRFIQEHLSL
ncbi:MAG: glycosyltransferase N-terminal domain-containing protein [Muriicola sp.]